MKSFSEAHPDCGVASADVEVHLYVVGRLQDASGMDVVGAAALSEVSGRMALAIAMIEVLL